MNRDDPDHNPNGAASDMAARRVKSVKGTKGDNAREARIKAALKANIAKRKAQARARDDEGTNDV